MVPMVSFLGEYIIKVNLFFFKNQLDFCFSKDINLFILKPTLHKRNYGMNLVNYVNIEKQLFLSVNSIEKSTPLATTR